MVEEEMNATSRTLFDFLGDYGITDGEYELFHITPTYNLPNVLQKGLIPPASPEEQLFGPFSPTGEKEHVRGVYLITHRTHVPTFLDEFISYSGTKEELVVLKVRLSIVWPVEADPGSLVMATVPTAVISYFPIPPDAISVHERIPPKQEADYDVTVAEYGDNITVHIRGIRATAELSKLGVSGAETFGLEPDNWLWFNRLINQSGIPGIGTVLLDKVLEYCGEKGYSIANQVSAYGDISQQDLEEWYIRKGFTPVDPDKYGNAFLRWVPR